VTKKKRFIRLVNWLKVAKSLPKVKCEGATTISITTLPLMTLSITALSITAFSMIMFRIKILGKKTYTVPAYLYLQSS
jgi:hypothetical protein